MEEAPAVVSAAAPLSIPFTDWGGDGPLVHLAHANGFPPSSYRRVALSLKDAGLHPVAMEFRPLWPGEAPPKGFCWDAFADDLAAFVEARGLRPIVAVGHSLGGTVSLMAAARRPDLFRAVVCIDPVIMSPAVSVGWRAAMRLGLSNRFRLVQMTKKRRTNWTSREEVRTSYGKKPPFNLWAEGVLDNYLEGGLREAPAAGAAGDGGEGGDGGVELAYSTAWEATIFSTYVPGLWRQCVKGFDRPILVVRGEKSDTFLPGAWKAMQKRLPHGRFIEIEGGDHFLPMTRPDEMARLIVEFINDIEKAPAPAGSPEG